MARRLPRCDESRRPGGDYQRPARAPAWSRGQPTDQGAGMARNAATLRDLFGQVLKKGERAQAVETDPPS